MTVKQSRIVLVTLLVSYLAGCSVAAYGAAFFCLAPANGLEWFKYPQAILLIVTIPVLVVGLLWPRIRVFAVVVGVLGLAGLGVQQVYLERGTIHCDAP